MSPTLFASRLADPVVFGTWQASAPPDIPLGWWLRRCESCQVTWIGHALGYTDCWLCGRYTLEAS